MDEKPKDCLDWPPQVHVDPPGTVIICIDPDGGYDGPDRDPVLYSRCVVRRRMRVVRR